VALLGGRLVRDRRCRLMAVPWHSRGMVTTPNPQGVGLLGSTAGPAASVPEGGAPACCNWCDLGSARAGISAACARRTDLEPFTERRVTRSNRQGSVGNVHCSRVEALKTSTGPLALYSTGKSL
jgi:hypothetical protein